VDLPAPLGPSSATTSPRASRQRNVLHGHDLGVAAAVDLRQADGFDGGRVWSGGHDSTLFGSTRMAFQMPSRLASTEMPTTMTPVAQVLRRFDHTRRGNFGKATCPANTPAVAERAHEQRLLENQADDHAVARAHQLEHRDVVNLVERERVEDQRHDDGGDDDEQDAEQADLPPRLVHHAGEQQVASDHAPVVNRHVRPGGDRGRHCGGSTPGSQRTHDGADHGRPSAGMPDGQARRVQQQRLHLPEVLRLDPRRTRAARSSGWLRRADRTESPARRCTVKKAQAVAARPTMPLGEPDDGVNPCPASVLAQRQAERTVGDHLVVGLAERAPAVERNPRARSSGQARPCTFMRSGRPRCSRWTLWETKLRALATPGTARSAMFEVGGHAGDLGERPARAALHHPQVRADAGPPARAPRRSCPR
jgi:hypothetical protein